MASAGGHWMKAKVGPYAGSMVFVPGVKSGTAKEHYYPAGYGNKGKTIEKNASVQGGLSVYQNEAGEWVVAHTDSGMSLGPKFDNKAGAMLAMEELNQAGGKIWTQNANEIQGSAKDLKPLADNLNKYKNITEGSAEIGMDLLKENYSINQKALQQKAAKLTQTSTQANQAAAAAKAPLTKANPENYGLGSPTIKGIKVEGGQVVYNKKTGKYDVLDDDNNVVKSYISLGNAQTAAPGAIAASKAGQASQTGAQVSPVKQGKLTATVPEGASQTFKDNAQDVQITTIMGKKQTVAGIPVEISGVEGQPSITYNKQTGKYHVNDPNGKTISKGHDTFTQAGNSLAKHYAPKEPSGTYAKAEKASLSTPTGKKLEGVAVDGGLVSFNTQSGKYELHNFDGNKISEHSSLGSAQTKAGQIKEYSNPNVSHWVSDKYGSVSAGESALASHFEKHAASLTSGENSAMNSYQDSGYTDLNGSMWSGNTAWQATKIANLNSAIKKSPGLPQAVKLSYKTSNSNTVAWAKNAKVGDIWKSKAFTSTSIDKNVWSGEIKFRFNAPKGLKGFFMNAKGRYSSHPGEKEYLIGPSNKWKLVNKTQSGSSIYLDMEWIGD